MKFLKVYLIMAIWLYPLPTNNEILVSEGYVVKFYRDYGTEWIANLQGSSKL